MKTSITGLIIMALAAIGFVQHATCRPNIPLALLAGLTLIGAVIVVAGAAQKKEPNRK